MLLDVLYLIKKPRKQPKNTKVLLDNNEKFQRQKKKHEWFKRKDIVNSLQTIKILSFDNIFQTQPFFRRLWFLQIFREYCLKKKKKKMEYISSSESINRM